MKIVELILDENETYNGIDAISIVENPAIEEDFIALKNQKQIMFAEINKDKKLLMGALLTPNRPIYRRQDEEEYYIYFSRDTVRKASQMFLKGGNQHNSTLEHKIPLQGLTLVESWIVEDKEKDKSSLYNMNVPIGTWMGTIKVENDQIWNEYVKTGKVKGFSIEGYFADKADVKKENMSTNNKMQMLAIEEEEAKELLSTINNIIKKDKRYKKGKTIMVESYSDYPTSVKNNARRGLELNKKNGNKCATQVGKVRAQQLAQGKPVSETTIKRMYSYLSRAETYYDNGTPEDCGYISYLLWGGKSAKNWAESKMKKFEGVSNKTKLATMRVNDEYAIIDDRLAFPSEEKATSMAEDLGCSGFHEHEVDGEIWFMPCEEHSVSLKAPCWDGYEMVGFKMKNGKKVPNCVPQE